MWGGAALCGGRRWWDGERGLNPLGVRVRVPSSGILFWNFGATDKYFVKENSRGGKEGRREGAKEIERREKKPAHQYTVTNLSVQEKEGRRKKEASSNTTYIRYFFRHLFFSFLFLHFSCCIAIIYPFD